MFKKDTVFVLGAGASWHYGYPTGEGLVDDVIAMAGRLHAHCTNRDKYNYHGVAVPKIVETRRKQGGPQTYVDAWRQVKRDCEELIERLRTVRPLVIDFFLAQNTDLRDIGTLMVAAVILAREPTWLRLKGNINRTPSPHDPFSVSRLEPANDDWYRFIVHKLVYSCKTSKDFLRNEVQFVTFNYDASLEFHLARALKAIDMLADADVETFLKDRIVHVYGCVHDKIPTAEDMVDERIAFSLDAPPQGDMTDWHSRAAFLDRCSLAATNLRTIDPHNKGANEKALLMARTAISDADVIYILGYGFDENNNERIGLSALGQSLESTSILFTNYRDMNTINKSVGRLLLSSPQFFTRQSIFEREFVYVEKSTRNVYDAFAMDFDPLEAI